MSVSADAKTAAAVLGQNSFPIKYKTVPKTLIQIKPIAIMMAINRFFFLNSTC